MSISDASTTPTNATKSPQDLLRWRAPGQRHGWLTLEAAIGVLTTGDPLMRAVLRVMLESQQENVLRQLGWQERDTSNPYKRADKGVYGPEYQGQK